MRRVTAVLTNARCCTSFFHHQSNAAICASCSDGAGCGGVERRTGFELTLTGRGESSSSTSVSDGDDEDDAADEDDAPVVALLAVAGAVFVLFGKWTYRSAAEISIPMCSNDERRVCQAWSGEAEARVAGVDVEDEDKDADSRGGISSFTFEAHDDVDDEDDAAHAHSPFTELHFDSAF